MIAFFVGVLLMVACTFIHYGVLRWLSITMPEVRWIHRRAKVMAVVLVSIASHYIQIALFGLAYYVLQDRFGMGSFGGQFTDALSTFLYFSAETYTSIGFGDIYPLGALRWVIGIEALTGLLMIGWTAAMIYMEMQRYWTRPGAIRR